MALALRKRISALRILNTDGKYFVPHKDLLRTVRETDIKRAISECGIAIYQQEEALGVILRGGTLVFAILSVISKERLIVDFMKHDNFLDIELDSRLPFEEDALRNIIPEDYRQFYDMEWEFSAPLFKPNLHHRMLRDRCVLPFVEVRELGGGGFGLVSKVTLKGSHQGIFQDGREKVENILSKCLTNLPFCHSYSHTSLWSFQNSLCVLIDLFFGLQRLHFGFK